jgi:hypothetical protein
MPGRWLSPSAKAPLNVGTTLLLTDGTLLAQDDFTADWWRLALDPAGDYANGTWSQAASCKHRRLYFASAVLADGRVFVGGGEYSEDANTASDLLASELFDPVTNIWSDLPAPALWTNMGDAPCCVLPDGTLLLGNIENGECQDFDPALMAWRKVGPKHNGCAAEETWTLLPDGTVLAVNCKSPPGSERYVDGTWRNEGNIPVHLVEAASCETGPAVLMPNGKVFAIGATGKTAIFAPQHLTSLLGIWHHGPDIPDVGGKRMAAKDAPACLLPNGHLLFVAGAVSGVRHDYGTTSVVFEYDGTVITQLTAQPANAAVSPYRCRLLMLPNGQAMLAASSQDVMFFVPDEAALASCVPVITQAPVHIQPGGSYVLRGRQLNGVSQACSYGDDASMATNYPLVRVRSRTQPRSVTYCRTFGHSTMGVATGDSDESTNFRVPPGVAGGLYDLEVVANGVASVAVEVTVKGSAVVPEACGPILKSTRDPQDDYALQEEMFWRDLNEVHLLMDYISGRADRSLTDMDDVPNPDAKATIASPPKLLPQQALERVCLIRFPPVGTAEQKAKDAALLLLVKDRLNALAFPARGLSVAFTAMFAGTAGATPEPEEAYDRLPRFGDEGILATIKDYVWGGPERWRPAAGSISKPTHHVTGFAIASYPNLEAEAKKFRWVFGLLPLVATLWLMLTALTSWDLAISSQALRNGAGDAALAAQAAATDDTCKIVATGNTRQFTMGGGRVPSSTACEALLRSEQPAFYADEADRKALFVDHDFWHPIGFVMWQLGPAAPAVSKPNPASGTGKLPCSADPECAYENAVAAFGTIVVSVFTDYVLPMMFGVLGTLAGLMRLISGKVRESTLSPRDYRLIYSLVPLGAVAGLSVGLVVTPGTMGSGNAALTLSAAGLAFLAGYGADAFFAMVDGILARVFTPSLPPSSGSK